MLLVVSLRDNLVAPDPADAEVLARLSTEINEIDRGNGEARLLGPDGEIVFSSGSAGSGELVHYLSPMAAAETIERAGELLAQAAGHRAKVILFGSHARGEARSDSDVDFLVIEPSVEDRAEEWDRLRQALGDIGLPVDIIVMSERTAERRAKVPGTVVYHAVRDGRVITQP